MEIVQGDTMVDVKGKWTLITGASRGIGCLTARYMADLGSNLILHSRKKEHTQKLAEELLVKGVQIKCVEAELADSGAVQRMLEEIDSFGIDVDIIFNNAGLQVAYRTDYLSTPVSDYVTSFHVNCIAPMTIVYHFLSGMKERNFGRIINTTSGIMYEPEQAGYSASKYGLNRVTIDLGKTVQGTNVCINLTDPGWCRTDLGGDKAPNSPESALPGYLVGALIDDKKSGRFLPAQDFAGLTLKEAVSKAEKEYASPY